MGLGSVSLHLCEVSGKAWTWRLQPDEISYLAGHMDYELMDEPTLNFLKDVPIAKVLYCIPDGTDELWCIEKGIPADLKVGTSTTSRSGRYLEFNPKGVDKGAGLQQLAELLGVDLADTIAAGGAANDASMVATASVGVCVASARDGLDQVANYQAQSTNNDGVLEEILEKIVLPAAGE